MAALPIGMPGVGVPGLDPTAEELDPNWIAMLKLPDLVETTVGATSFFNPMDKPRLIFLRRVVRRRCGHTPGDPDGRGDLALVLSPA